MAQVKDLAALMPAEVAKKVAWEIISVTTTATTQGSTGGALAGPGNKIVRATPHTGDGAVTLPANADIGDELIIMNVAAGATSLDLFPPSGGNFQTASADAGEAVAQGVTAHVIKTTGTEWLLRLGAAPAGT